MWARSYYPLRQPRGVLSQISYYAPVPFTKTCKVQERGKNPTIKIQCKRGWCFLWLLFCFPPQVLWVHIKDLYTLNVWFLVNKFYEKQISFTLLIGDEYLQNASITWPENDPFNFQIKLNFSEKSHCDECIIRSWWFNRTDVSVANLCCSQ